MNEPELVRAVCVNQHTLLLGTGGHKLYGGCGFFMAVTSVSCCQSIQWRPRVTFSGQGQHREGGKRKNILERSSTLGLHGNLQNIMTAASLLIPGAHTASLWGSANLGRHGERE